MPEIWPFCCADCLRADPDQATDEDFRRRLGLFYERNTGAGGPGGMIITAADERLRWYLAGAQDEAAIRDGIDWGHKVGSKKQ